MITELARKASGVLALLQGSHFVPQASGQPIYANDRKGLLHLMNEQRRRRRARGLLHEPGLSTSLNHPESAGRDFLPDLTNALGLCDLGFDQSIWLRPYDLLIELVRSALSGGVLRTVLEHEPWERLFLLHPAQKMGWVRQEDADEPEERLFDAVPEFTVLAGDKIGASANMPFDGYLRVCSSMEQHFFGMHELLAVPTHRLPQGEARFASSSTSARVARTVVYAFASRDESVFAGWPIDDLWRSQVTHGHFLHLVHNFFQLPPDDRRSSVQSFLTTARPSDLQ